MKSKIFTRFAAFMLMLALCCIPALAFAEATATAESASVTAGDTVTVTFTVTGDGLSVAEGSFTYDPALLSFDADGSSAGVTDGLFALYSADKNGASSLAARVSFKALLAGDAKIDFKLEKLINYSAKELGTDGASVTVTIAAAPAEPTPPPVDYSDPALSVKASNVDGASGDMYIWRNIDEVTVPSRYAGTDITYHGETVPGLTVKDTNAPTLLYLTDASGEGGYYIFDEAADRLYRYRTVASVSKSYILLSPGEDVSVPEGFQETTLTVDGVKLRAWSMTDAQGEVYILYARSPSGDVGFYYYDPLDESMQRCAVLRARPVEPVMTPAPTATPDIAPTLTPSVTPGAVPSENSGISPMLFYIVCGIAALCLALFVGSLILRAMAEKKRRARAAERRRKEREALGIKETDA